MSACRELFESQKVQVAAQLSEWDRKAIQAHGEGVNHSQIAREIGGTRQDVARAVKRFVRLMKMASHEAICQPAGR